MIGLVRIGIVIIITTFATGNDSPKTSPLKPFSCFTDVCNLYGQAQFCSRQEEKCRDCLDVIDSCYEPDLPSNCTRTCIEYHVQKAITKAKEDYCVITLLVLNIDNGKVSAPEYNDSRISEGSEMLYHCYNGYTLKGFDRITCLGNGTWSHNTLPFCMSNISIGSGYKYATIALACTCFALLVIGVVTLYCLRRNSNDGKVSRASTEESLDKEDQPLIPEQTPSMHNETETLSVSTKPYVTNFDDKLPNESPESVHQSAPPAAEESHAGDKDENEPKNEKAFSSQDTKVPQIVVNNHMHVITQTIVSNAQNIPNAPQTSGEKETDGYTPPYRKFNIPKAIDEKQSTEETNEVNTVQETPSEKEENGTEPLAARDADHLAQPTDADDLSKVKEMGPQVVPSQEIEPNISPTEETGNGKKSDMVALNDVTFPRNDIKRNERQAEEADDSQRLDELKEVEIE